MGTLQSSLSQIESLIENEKVFQDKNSKNFPITEKITDYDERMKQISYWRFVEFADYHYFVSRILFLKKVFDYSMFCANQCIENYFKAYIKLAGVIPSSKHGLLNFLYKCREISKKEKDFLHSKQCLTIISKYHPFEEYARYPVHHERPGDIFQYSFPNDIYLLDFFVYSIRQYIPKPEGSSDLFTDSHQFLDNCRSEFPSFFSDFIRNNINFPNQFPEIDLGYQYVHLRIKDFGSVENK